MADREFYAESKVREDLAQLLGVAVAASGRTRGAIAHDAGIHKDAFRRILTGKRSATLGEASRILLACDFRPSLALALFLVLDADRCVQWFDTDLATFLEDFLAELPDALKRVLGNQLHELRPRWAKGTAHRVARLLSDHIDDLERRDTLYVEPA